MDQDRAVTVIAVSAVALVYVPVIIGIIHAAVNHRLDEFFQSDEERAR